jgi:hypothetical protein
MYFLHKEIDAIRLLVNGDHVGSVAANPLVYLGEGLRALIFILSYCSEKRRFPALPIM